MVLLKDLYDCLMVCLSFTQAVVTLGAGMPESDLTVCAGLLEKANVKQEPKSVRISSGSSTNNLGHAMTNAAQTSPQSSADKNDAVCI